MKVLKEIYPQDVFFISYPKSGSTWMRFVIGSYISDFNCGSFASNKIIPGIHAQSDLCDKMKPPRYMHGHFPFREEFRKVIYIVRDPRDVAVSYYFHYLKTKHIDSGTTFELFLEKFNKGDVFFGLWNDHINSWLDLKPSNFLCVKYEDVRMDQVCKFSEILEFLNIEVDKNKLERAIEYADFDNMARMEKELNKIEKVFLKTNQRIPFVRKGIIGDHKNHFNEKLEKEFIQIHDRAMRRLGYIA